MDTYEHACEQLARVGEAWRLLPGERYARHALCPCSAGYRASLAEFQVIGITPSFAVRRLLQTLASYVGVSAWRAGDHVGIPGELLDALSEAYEALGGDWRAA